MTLAAMQWHEAVTLRYGATDYRRRSLTQLARQAVRGARVLDLRCLTGHLAVGLAEEGRAVTALDGYSGAVEMTNALARRRGIHVPIARLWDLTGLPARVGAERFDTVLCLDVLNHVEDDEATLAEIATVLAPGGRAIVSAPAFPALLGPRDRSLGHLRRYTKAGLTALLSRHGLQVVRVRYWNFAALPAYVAIEKLWRRRLSDRLRYGRGGRLGSLPNRALGWWYAAVENLVPFPCGLSLFVVAQKGKAG